MPLSTRSCWTRSLLTTLVLMLGSSPLVYSDDFSIFLQQQADQGEIAQRDSKLEIQLRSQSGIGRVQLQRKCIDTPWPDTIVLRIEYLTGEPLRELEGFTLRGQRVRVTGSRRASGQMDRFDLAEDRESFRQKPSGKAKIRVDRTKESMRIRIPGRLLAGETSVEIQWIDYYRG